MIKRMSSLGKQSFTDQLIVKELGSSTTPVETIHRASTDIYQNDLNWIDADTNHTRLRLKEDGHLQCVEDVELFTGPDIATGTKRFSVGLDASSDFVIRDEVADVDRISIDSEGNITGIAQSDINGLVAALEGKQAALTVDGQPVSTVVLNTFALAAGGDGAGYSNSLLTAGAIENWFEALQTSLIMVSPG